MSAARRDGYTTLVDMQLAVVWHKTFWRSSGSASGFAAHGGLGRQVEALSDLFDATRVVGACSSPGDRPGERALAGHNLTVAALTELSQSPALAWLALPIWLARNGAALAREIERADAVMAALPSPIGLLGLFLALVMKKRLVVRPMNGWSEPRLLWRMERVLLEYIAGGRTVVLATGSGDLPPSRKNPAIEWIFSTTFYASEIAASAPRIAAGRVRLAIVGRQLEAEGARIIIGALPRLATAFPSVTLDVVGHGPALPALVRFADDLQVGGRVVFHGALSHERVLELLGRADLLCLPTPENESTRQTTVEAFACGVPVIASCVPFPAARCSIAMLDVLTPEAVAGAVAMCLRDPERYRAMSMAALDTARAHTLERWREIVRERLERAWGPLQSVAGAIPVDART